MRARPTCFKFAAHPVRLAPRPRREEDGQQESRQHGDNGDDDEQLNQGKAFAGQGSWLGSTAVSSARTADGLRQTRQMGEAGAAQRASGSVVYRTAFVRASWYSYSGTTAGDAFSPPPGPAAARRRAAAGCRGVCHGNKAIVEAARRDREERHVRTQPHSCRASTVSRRP